MRTITAPRCLLALLLTAALAVGGCGHTQPVTYYALTSLPTDHSEAVKNSFRDVRIGVGPVRFPRLIDRPQIVTRITPNRVDLSEFHRWGGDLSEDFLIVMTDNMSRLCGAGQWLRYPWPPEFSPRYRIEFDVHQFDGTPGGSVVLNVTWMVRTQGGDDLFVKSSLLQEKAADGGYEGLVEAKSRILEKLSRIIVEELSARR